MALHPDREGRDAAQDEERVERCERRAGIDLDALDRGDPLLRADDDAGEHVAVAAQVLRRRLDDEVRPELERPADVRRGERVVDDDRRPVAVGDLGERRDGRPRRSSGWRWSRRRGRASAPPRGPPRPPRGRSCRRSPRGPRTARSPSSSWSGSSRRSRPGATIRSPADTSEAAPRGWRPSRTRARCPASAAGQLRVGAAEGAVVGLARRLYAYPPRGPRRPPSSSASPPRTSPSGRSGRRRRWSSSGRAWRPGWRGSRSPGVQAGAGVAGRCRRRSRRRCYTGVARPLRSGLGTPVTRSCRPASSRTSPGRR